MKFIISIHATKTPLVITGIALAGTMAAMSWYHHSLRKTMRYEHELWKDSQGELPMIEEES